MSPSGTTNQGLGAEVATPKCNDNPSFKFIINTPCTMSNRYKISDIQFLVNRNSDVVASAQPFKGYPETIFIIETPYSIYKFNETGAASIAPPSNGYPETIFFDETPYIISEYIELGATSTAPPSNGSYPPLIFVDKTPYIISKCNRTGARKIPVA